MQDFAMQRESERNAAPETAAGTPVQLVPGSPYCLMPHSWLQVRCWCSADSLLCV